METYDNHYKTLLPGGRVRDNYFNQFGRIPTVYSGLGRHPISPVLWFGRRRLSGEVVTHCSSSLSSRLEECLEISLDVG